MIGLKNKISLFKYIIIIVSTSLVLNFVINSNNKVTIISILLILISFLAYKNLPEKEMIYIKFNKPFLSLFILFLVTLITQNVNLNFETLDWDIHSYLVVALDIDRGNIPLENQWESKGPLLFYLYNFIFKIGDSNFVYFKVLNDLILFFISSFLFFSVYKSEKKNAPISFVCSIFFILLMSQTWGQAEYSEIYSLVFISAVYFIFLNFNLNTKNLFLISLLLSFSTLINQGTILFVLGFGVALLLKYDYHFIKKNILYCVAGFILPHLFFLLIYINKDLFSVYKTTFYDIPIGYIGASLSSVRELSIFLRTYFVHDLFLYISIIVTISFVLISIGFKNIRFKKNTFLHVVFINLFISFMFYFIGSHNYYHHLFFLLYFISFLPNIFKKANYKLFIMSLILLSSFSISINSFHSSFKNLKNINSLIYDYPLYQVSMMIDDKFEKDYSIFALDYVAVLHYLNKSNYSYIVHPSNHFEPYITDSLIKSNKIRTNEVNKLINENPDIILCSGRKIMSGEIKRQEFFNCEISDWKKNYLKLDTFVYKDNRNLNYYRDPYRPIDLFIKTSP